MSTSGSHYPLLFAFHEAIVGRGFVAGVEVRGRAIAEQEGEGQWWVYGVNPGALAECGSGLHSAVENFRLRLKTALVDFAEEASDFQAFKQSATAFFATTDQDTEGEWEAARQAVRAGRIDLAELPKDRSERAPTIMVKELALEPGENPLGEAPSSLAA